MDQQQKPKFSYDLVKERIHSLPSLPAVVAELMTLSKDSEDFLERVVELAKLDPPLASRILRVANSVLSAPNTPIADLHTALVRLGVIRTVALVSALSVARIFYAKDSEHKAVWQHSIETACLSRLLANLIPEFRIDPELAYTCGLLHDIGRFILLRISPKLIGVIDGKGWESPTELPGVEKKLIGFTHADVGVLAAKEWNLPEDITLMIHYHHRYDLWHSDQLSGEQKRLISVVQFADMVSVFIELHPDWADLEPEELKQRIETVCSHPQWPLIDFHIDEMVEELPAVAAECTQFLEALKIG